MVARTWITQLQAKYGSGNEPSSEPPLTVALNALQQRKSETEAQPNGWLRYKRLLYAPELERARWATSQTIIERSMPGPLEDGGTFERLAREAASVEWWVGRNLDEPTRQALPRVVLGTTARPTSHAGTLGLGGGAAILFSAGLMNLIDILAITSMAARPYLHHDPGYFVFSDDAGKIRDKVRTNPPISNSLTTFFEMWLKQGLTPPADFSLVQEEAMLPYILLRAHAERFIVAHEYAHALEKLGLLPLGDEWGVGQRRLKEIRADIFASRVLVETAARLDETGPSVALRGGVLALKAHELLDSALAMIRHPQASAVSIDYPSFEERSAICREAVQWFWNDARDPGDPCIGAQTAAQVADIVWQESKEALEPVLRRSELHPIWRNPL